MSVQNLFPTDIQLFSNAGSLFQKKTKLHRSSTITFHHHEELKRGLICEKKFDPAPIDIFFDQMQPFYYVSLAAKASCEQFYRSLYFQQLLALLYSRIYPYFLLEYLISTSSRHFQSSLCFLSVSSSIFCLLSSGSDPIKVLITLSCVQNYLQCSVVKQSKIVNF